MTYTKEQIQQILREGVATVTFTKVNSNEVRVMPCTLNPNLITEATIVGDVKRERKPNDQVLSVWCTDKEAWRSFRIENVISVESQ